MKTGKKILVWFLLFITCLSVIPVSLAGADSYPIADAVEKIDKKISEARSAFLAGDRKALSKPVQYKVLWLGYTHVTFGKLDFRMTDADKKYLKAAAKSFEKYIEKITSHNLDVKVTLGFVSKKRTLTQWPGDNFLYLSKETAAPDLKKYLGKTAYDTILTTIQTAGDQNVNRNKKKSAYTKYYAITGLKTHGITDDIGYSTFDLGLPDNGKYTTKHPEDPTMLATAVAVHEWMHQLEALGTLLNIDYPDTHAYMGPPEFPGYKKIVNGKKKYDFFEFYDQVLSGRVPYTKNGKKRYIGLYPKMIPLIKRGATALGTFTIQNEAGQYLSAQKKDPKVTLSDKAYKWNLIYNGDGRVVFIPSGITEWRLDLSNAWDGEGNTVSLWEYTGYEDAQSWKVTANSDGSICIRTPYSSGRALTVSGKGDGATIRHTETEPSADQRWYFTKMK